MYAQKGKKPDHGESTFLFHLVSFSHNEKYKKGIFQQTFHCTWKKGLTHADLVNIDSEKWGTNEFTGIMC